MIRSYFIRKHHHKRLLGEIRAADPAAAILLSARPREAEPGKWALIEFRIDRAADLQRVFDAHSCTTTDEDEIAFREARQSAYPPVGDQLDAIWTYLAQEKAAGRVLAMEANVMLDRVLAAKAKVPKPE